MKRSKRKGPYQKILDLKKKKIQLLPRNFEITSNIVGLNFLVHSGKKLIPLTVFESMIGHRVGEFIPTREKFEFKKKKRGK